MSDSQNPNYLNLNFTNFKKYVSCVSGVSEFFLGFICNYLSYFTTAKTSFTSNLIPTIDYLPIYPYCTSHNSFEFERKIYLITIKALMHCNHGLSPDPMIP